MTGLLLRAVVAAAVLLVQPAAAQAQRTVLSRGHVDVLNVRLENGALRVTVKDGTVAPAAIRRPEDVLLHAKPQSAVTLPEDLPAEFGFLGRPGETVWVLPEVQQDDILWPGWDTSGVPAGAFAGGELSWRLLSVAGPGALALFTSDPVGRPNVIFNSADGLPDASTMPVNTHVHANWAFSRPGLYKLRFDLSGMPVGGGAAVGSGPVEYWFFAGDLADLPEDPPPGGGGPDGPGPGPEPGGAGPLPSPPGSAPRTPSPPRPTLRLSAASLRGRTLTLRTRLGTRSRISVSVQKGKRTVARAKPRTVSASSRMVRVRLDRRLARGRYRVRVTAAAGGVRVTRSLTLDFRRHTRQMVAVSAAQAR